MKFLKVRATKSPSRWTSLSSWIDFYVPDFLENTEIKEAPLEKTDWETTKVIGWEFVIESGKGVLIPLWLKVLLPEGCDLVFYNKSGVASKKGLLVGACVIDNDYRWELILNLYNPTKYDVVVKCNEKIVQGIIRKVSYNDVSEISEKEFEEEETTERGEGWFGSTGVQ